MPPVSSLPEEPSLVAAARRQEAAAWDRLLAAYQAPLHAYVAELIRDSAAAQDLVQESFRRAVRHIGGLRDEARFGSWLFGIAHQQCLQHFRGHRRWHERFAETMEPVEEPVDESLADPCEQLMRREEAEAFFELLERLPAAQRSVLPEPRLDLRGFLRELFVPMRQAWALLGLCWVAALLWAATQQPSTSGFSQGPSAERMAMLLNTRSQLHALLTETGPNH